MKPKTHLSRKPTTGIIKSPGTRNLQGSPTSPTKTKGQNLLNSKRINPGSLSPKGTGLPMKTNLMTQTVTQSLITRKNAIGDLIRAREEGKRRLAQRMTSGRRRRRRSIKRRKSRRRRATSEVKVAIERKNTIDDNPIPIKFDLSCNYLSTHYLNIVQLYCIKQDRYIVRLDANSDNPLYY